MRVRKNRLAKGRKKLRLSFQILSLSFQKLSLSFFRPCVNNIFSPCTESQLNLKTRIEVSAT